MKDLQMDEDSWFQSDDEREMAGEARDPSSLALNSDALFRDLLGAKGVVLAVSGGPDSVALMLLAAEWTKDRAAPKLHVATVDHALRAESAGEAAQVALWAKALGLPHKTLVWEGAKPRTRIQERARDARYVLLDAYAAEIGADYLLTAHHADDQAETILFRLLRGSGIDGLAGMTRRTQRGGITHLRPLLDHPKEALIAFCEAHSQSFFHDPSNDNTLFARARLRQLLPILAKEGLDRDALLRLARRATRIAEALDSSAQKLRAALPAGRAEGRVSATISGLVGEPLELFIRVIAMEIEALEPSRPLRLERLETLASALREALKNRSAWRATLAGLAFDLNLEGSLTISPEKPRHRGRRSQAETENSPSREGVTSPCHDPVTSG
jgi:tRNA(Ile)-lysidine synthase